MEPLDDRIARRRVEIAEEQATLDREQPQRDVPGDAAAAVVERRRGGSALRSTLFLILLIVVAAGLFGAAVTLTRLAGKDFDDVQRQGRAQVTSCVRHGPISAKGFGYWDRCTATITWDDGVADRITVGAVFNSSDVGTDVRVGDLGNYRTSRVFARADTSHRPWLAWIGYVVGAIAFIPALVVVLSARELLRFRPRH